MLRIVEACRLRRWRRCLRTMSPESDSYRLLAGRWGEGRAAQHLRRAGLRILRRNWRRGREEIDLVCLRKGTLVFVEVRTRAAGALVGGYASLDRRKRAAFSRAVQTYLRGLRRRPAAWRCDVVEVDLGPGPADDRIRHHENVRLS